MALRAFDAYGPAVSEEDKGRYLVEQLELARLLNVPVDEVPTTPASLDAYMTSMTPHLAYGSDTIWFKRMTMAGIRLWQPATYTPALLATAAASLMSDERRDLYGVGRPAWYFEANRLLVRGLLEADEPETPVVRTGPPGTGVRRP